MSDGEAPWPDEACAPEREAIREELPNRRRSERRKIEVDGQRVYVEVGFYPDGRLGEVFLTVGKKGAVLRDLLDGLAIVLSTALQHGIPLRAYSVPDGGGSELTGRGNSRMLEAIFATMEELCNEKPAVVRATGPAVPCPPAAGDRPAVEPEPGDPPSTPHP